MNPFRTLKDLRPVVAAELHLAIACVERKWSKILATKTEWPLKNRSNVMFVLLAGTLTKKSGKSEMEHKWNIRLEPAQVLALLDHLFGHSDY
jgi:hypothetical protein